MPSNSLGCLSHWCRSRNFTVKWRHESAQKSTSLLVVDDDPGLVKLAARTLERGGYAVATAASGTEAVEWLTRNRPGFASA